MLFFKFSSKDNVINNINYTEASIRARRSNYFNFDKKNLMDDKKNSIIFGLESAQARIFDYYLV